MANKQKSFDVEIHELDANGNPLITTETGVLASSRQELAGLYAMCGQKIRILREYEINNSHDNDLDTVAEDDPIRKKFIKMPEVPEVSSDSAPEIPTSDMEVKIQDKISVPADKPAPTPRVFVPPKKEPPKFFTISGIKCKLEDGKVYQKQWVKLLGEEANNYRLISDTNNKEVPMNGKHLEVMKWISVEDEGGTTASEIQQILRG